MDMSVKDYCNIVGMHSSKLVDFKAGFRCRGTEGLTKTFTVNSKAILIHSMMKGKHGRVGDAELSSKSLFF